MKWFYLFLLALLFVTGLFHAYQHGIDYPGYEFASLRIWQGIATTLYDDPSDPIRSYYYSYSFALAFLPIALLGQAGRFVFFCLFWAAYLKVLHFSLNSALKLTETRLTKSTKYLILSGLVLLTTYSVNDAFMNLNIGILLLALILIAFEQRIARPLLSGLLLGIAISFKSYPVVILGFFIWEWRWKVVAASIASALFFIFALPVLVHGYNDGQLIISKHFYILSHIEEIWNNRGWGFDGYIFQNITGTTLRYAGLLGLNAKNVLNWVMGISTLLIISFYLRSFFVPLDKRDPKMREQMFLFALALIPLFIPTSWYNLGLFYTPLIALTLIHAVVLKDRLSQGAVIVFATLYCLTTPDLVSRPINEKLSFFSIPFLGILFLLGQALFKAKRQSSTLPN